MAQDRYEEMEQCKEALDLAREREDRPAEAAALYGIGRIYFQDKVAEAAADFWSRCEAVCRDSGQDMELAQVLIDLGDLALEQDDPDPARERFEEALGLYRRENQAQGQARVLERLGGLALKAEDHDEARRFYQEGLSLCRKHQDRIGSIFFLDQIIPLLKALGAAEEVIEAYREQVTLAESLGDTERMALGLVGLADVYQRTGRTSEAVPHLEMAHDVLMRQGKEKEAGLIREELGRLGQDPPPSSSPK